jgi:Na+-driven multidrug efflux pump
MPTSLLLGVVQAACLGAKDSVTPLIAILWATAVNISGDFLLVKQLGMGLKGAALATLFAQWASTAALLGPARRRLIRNHSFELFNRAKKSDGSAKTFLAFALPVLTLILGKLAAFGFMTHSAAALPDQPTALASHQIILSLFFFVSPFMEVISQTAQTFLPPFLAPVADYIESKRQKNADYDPTSDPVPQTWQKASFTCATQLLKIGFLSAVTVASIASLVPAYFGNMLTQDLVVQEAIKPLAKLLWIGAFLTGPVAVSEGVLLARRELRYLATIYLVSTAVLPSALLRIKTMKGSISQIWACFAAFQLFRAACFAGKIWFMPIMNRIGQAFGVGSESSKKDVNVA